MSRYFIVTILIRTILYYNNYSSRLTIIIFFRAENEAEALKVLPYEGATYAHTYHGPTRHLRAPLAAIAGPSVGWTYNQSLIYSLG